MKKIVSVIGIVVALLGCDKGIREEEHFTGIMSQYANGSFNFFGYQLNDVAGFDRHPMIDTIRFKINDVFTIDNHYKIQTDSTHVNITESDNPPVPFTEIVNKGSSVADAADFNDAHPYSMLSGIKLGKVWLGMFDRVTKKQLNEWLDQTPFDLKLDEVVMGDRVTFTIDHIFVSAIYKLREGYAIGLTTTWQGEDYDVAGYILMNDRMVKMPFSLSKGFLSGIYDWYEQHYLMGQYDLSTDRFYYSILSPEGELIETFTSKEMPEGYPLGLHEWISVSLIDGYIMRRNFDGTIFWQERLMDIMAPDFQNSTCSLLNDDTNLWVFSADILNGDESKKTVKFSVDITNGKIQLIG